jgi:hypothetical protein
MTIDGSGNVGIGSASDGAILQLDRASSSYLDIQSDSTLRTRLYNDSAQTILETTTNNLIFKSASSEAMRIDSSGRVGIGTTSPYSAANTHELTIFNSSNAWNQRAGIFLATENQGTYNSEIYYHRGTSNDTDNGLKFRVHDTEVMTLKGSGKVGIGTSSPASALQVNNTTFPQISARNTSTKMGYEFNQNGTQRATIFYDDSIGNGVFGLTGRLTGESNSVYLHDGNVGIGTASPSELFTVSSSTANSYNYQSISGGNQPDHFVFKSTDTVVGSITRVGGSSVAYNTSSDYRLKENVVPMTGSIDRLKELKPSKFNFITDADTTVDGFLAHEVSDTVPEAISGEKDAMRTEDITDEEGNVTGTQEVPDMQGIDQSKLVPLLVSALQEAITRIEILENK